MIEPTEHPELSLMRQLMKTQAVDHVLPRHFYTSEAVYQNDIERFWNRSWIWVGHVSQIPNTGDYFLFAYGSESIIVVRDTGGQVHAHLNVCRHRGSRVCVESSGNTRSFTCPYHAWNYGLNGMLRSNREMGASFDPSRYSLLSVQVKIFQGLIFICAASDAPDIDSGLKNLAPLTAPFALDKLKIAHTAVYTVDANWKLALENYMECYHCAPAHKAYSKAHSLKDPSSITEELLNRLQERSLQSGLPIEELSESGAAAQSVGADLYYRRYPLYSGYKTGSLSGKPIAPLLGTLSDFDGGATDIQIGVLNNFLAYSDHIIGYRFIPTALQKTDIQVVWMVREDAQEGADYDLDNLTWLWHETSLDDERIIRHNQAGVNSHHYIPGPLSNMEWGIRAFYDSYLKMI